MSADERDRLHEMLCAYLLGEAHDDERATVEAALAGSRELRAERARLERTIGLVQHAFPADESLSDAALSALMAAAGDARGQAPSTLKLVGGGAWYHAPAVRAAAAVVALLGGVFGLLQYPTTPVGDADPVASADASRAPRGPAVRLLLGEVAAVRAKNEALLAAHVAPAEAEHAPAADEEPAAELAELLAFTRDALAKKEYERASRWAETARDKHAGDTDLELLVRLTDRQDGAALEYVEELQQARAGRAGELEATRARTENLFALGDNGALRGSEGSALGVADAKRGEGQVTPLAQDVAGAPDPGATRDGLEVPNAPGTAAPQPEQPGSLRAAVVGGGGGGQPEAPARELGRGRAALDAAPAARPETQGKASGPEQVEALPVLRERFKESAGRAVPGARVAESKKVRKLAEDRLAEEAPQLQAGDARAQLGGADLLRLPQRQAGADGSSEAIDEHLHFDGDEELADAPFEGAAGARRALTAPEIDERVAERFETVRVDSLPRPGERPRDMFFRWWGDNPFVVTDRDRLATFSVDVDTASYVLARRYLNEGHLPQKAQIRTEEFVNYFRPDLPAPTQATFAVTTELAPSPFGGGAAAPRQLLRVGLRGKEVLSYERKPLVLTFVVDTSGSMREGGRLELVKHAMRLLVSQLDARDMVGVVTYSKEARQLLPPTSASNRGLFDSLVGPLQPGGGTNAEAGLQLGYEVALAAHDAQADNRVVFLSDGVANIGETDQDRINASIERHRAQRIFLNTIGVGMQNHNDVFLEQLADRGDGICDYIDDERAAERAIVERFSGAFTPIASDVKIQVDFDPTQVLRYRLLGYENRAIADADFRNDAVDAGEVGAGHQVTALFELERGGYGTGAPIASVHVRWQPPAGATGGAEELAHPVHPGMAAPTFASASAPFQRAALAARFAEFLRRSVHAEQDPYGEFLAELQRVAALPALAADADTQELLALATRAGALLEQAPVEGSALEEAVDDYRRYRYLREELKGTESRLRRQDLRALEQTERELEGRLRGLIREDVRRAER
jgi:Ca-activated chloride channel family protein